MFLFSLRDSHILDRNRNFFHLITNFNFEPELEARVLTAFERFAQNGELTKTDFVHAWNNCDLESNGSKREMEAVFDKLDVLNQERIDRRKYIIGVKHQIIKVSLSPLNFKIFASF